MKIPFLSSKQVLLSLFVITILILSCNKEFDKIGLDIQPAEDKLNVKYNDTTTLVTYSVREDSIPTGNSSVSLLGSYKDPIMGKSTASIYTQLRLSIAGYNFGEAPILDSLILSLAYSGSYGDTTTSQTVKVYELSGKLYPDSSYYSNHNIQKCDVELANYTFIPKPHDSVVVGNDTLPPQLRINLSSITSELGNKLLNASETDLEDNENFLEFFHGLFITAEPVEADGAILYFDLMSTISQMVIYYQNAEEDSLQFNFVINDNCARFNNYNHNNYEDAIPEFKNQVLNSDTSLGDNMLYLQALGGVKTKIRFPNIKDFISSGNIAVNQAMLIIKGIEENDDYEPPSRLALVKINEEGKTEILIDQYEGDIYFGGTYISSDNEYRFRISRHIQHLLTGSETDYGLYLMISGSSIKADRLTIYGANPNPPIPLEDRIRLALTYTILN